MMKRPKMLKKVSIPAGAINVGTMPDNVITKQVNVELPEELQKALAMPNATRVDVPYIQTPPGHFKNLDADYDGTFREASFFIPIKDETKPNLICGADELYTGIVQDTFDIHVTTYNGNIGVYNIAHKIGNKADNYFVNVVRTNMNIIIYNSLIALIARYATCDPSVIYDLYSQATFDNYGPSIHIKEDLMKLVQDDNGLCEYQKNNNELQKIMQIGAAVRYKLSTHIASILYNFINAVVFGDYIDSVRFNLDILNNFNEVVMKEATLPMPMEEIKTSAKSLVVQYLLEVANLDTIKIIEMSDAVYLTVVNSILHDIYLVKGSNMICINPFKHKEDDYDF